MEKRLIALALVIALAMVVAACGLNASKGENMGPAMEGNTIAAATSATSDISTESALQAAESESAAQTTAATSFSAGKTAQAAATSATQAVNAKNAPTVAATQPTTRTTAPTTKGTTITKVPTIKPVTTMRTTTTTRYVPPPTTATTTTTTEKTTTTTTTPITTTKALSDFEAMGQTLYQTKVVEALNAMRAERGMSPMTQNPALMASCLAQAQKMASAGKAYHTEGNPPGFESVAMMPYYWPAQTLGENLTNHVSNFLEPQYGNVGIAVIRSGNQIYAVMQGN